MKKKKKNSNFKDTAKKYFLKIIAIIKMPEMASLPGQMTFSMMLSLVPLLALSCYAANLFGFDYNLLIDLVNSFIPGGANYLLPPLDTTGISFLFIILIIWMFYLSSSGFNSIILISNQIYGIEQSTWLRRRLKAMFMSLMLIFLFIILLVFNLYGSKLTNTFFTFKYGKEIYSVLRYLKYPLEYILLLLIIKFFYNFCPDRVRNESHINLGSIVTTTGWFIITMIYEYIARHMNNYILLYGGLANIALLMVWMYCLSYIFVIGLALNHSDEVSKDDLID